MCTIVVLNGVSRAYPVVIAANRDEYYARPARPPERLAEHPIAIGGVDEESGGTWMGATANGLFVGLTNQPTHGGVDKTLESRGMVVRNALAMSSTADIDAMLHAIDAREYNGFNLVYGDAGGMRVAYARTGVRAVEIDDLPRGVHVMPNDRLDSSEFPKVQRARRLADALTGAPWHELAIGLHRLLGDHVVPDAAEIPVPPAGSIFTHATVRPLHALCVHTELYGTRSSTIVALEPGRVARYLVANGRPCETELADVTHLLT